MQNNVLPKYGFTVDTVELLPDASATGKSGALQLARDLQMAIAEYAPGAEVVADGQMYVSRYIRKQSGKNTQNGWEFGNYCERCTHCGQPNFTKDPVVDGRECVSCHQVIRKSYWRNTLEPRRGFCAEKEPRPVPLRRPDRDYKTDDYYIGDSHSNTINKYTFTVNGHTVTLESTTNDSLVVVGQTAYKVCAICGYATDGTIPNSHKTSRGYDRFNTDGIGKEYRLSHDFRTDVAKITFFTPEASSLDMMLSVLYALLEGLSQEMGIERTDLKGCLHKVSVNGLFIYSIVLYDAVAGGAGHVRRIASDSVDSFQRVLRKAISITEKCSCQSSCYGCLRNYYNQKIHDQLNRESARTFLTQWLGAMILLRNEDDDESGNQLENADMVQYSISDDPLLSYQS